MADFDKLNHRSDELNHRSGTGHGFGRILVFVYGVFALSATARSSVQLTTKASEAPLAYGLSAFAAVVYVIATWAMATDRRRLAWAAVLIELAGVLVVGTLSVAVPEDFQHPSVWSEFGAGYGYVPLVLPFVGLWWLWRQGRDVGDAADVARIAHERDSHR